MTTAMAAPPKAEMPPALLAELSAWAQQYAHDAGAGLRDALATADSEKLALQADLDEAQAARDHAQSMAEERDEEIQRLTAELRNARQIATDAGRQGQGPAGDRRQGCATGRSAPAARTQCDGHGSRIRCAPAGQDGSDWRYDRA